MRRPGIYIGLILITAIATWAITALLLNIQERKDEGKVTHWNFVELTEETVDAKEWGKNFPRQYDAYLKTSDTERTRYGGSEVFSKIDMNPIWKRLFAGYGFGVDYREEHGHAYSLSDQKETLRTKNYKQPGACIHCHAGGMKNVYEKLGEGDLMKGFAIACPMPLEKVWELAGDHPISCIDCHDPKDMSLRITRPGFINGIKLVKAQQGIKDYDPNTMASRQEMRTYVCAQCHVEYYFSKPGKLVTYPWHNGLTMDGAEAYYDSIEFADWKHAETGTPTLKAQHPEFELWSQGIHSRSGVACADCHMPYQREGAVKISDHHVRSPLLNIRKACLQCHHFSEKEMLDRAETIQGKTAALLKRSEEAHEAMLDAIVAAKDHGISDAELEELQKLHRKAQWRLDYISAENSMGFHAPQEAARILAESIDFARQGEGRAKLLKATTEKQAADAQ